MIILDERKSLVPLLESNGFGVFDFFENHTVMDMQSFASLELRRRHEFLLVDTQTVLNHPESMESFKSVLNTCLCAIFFHDHSNVLAQEWVKNQGGFLNKIIGEYSLPMPQLGWTILSNQIQFFWSLLDEQKKLQKHLAQFSSELDEVLQNAELEMVKAKKIHETLVPRRREEIKGVTFSTKYAAGDGGGGEFYDLIQTSSKIYQILLSGSSYLISSAVMGILEKHKNNVFDPFSFIKDSLAEIETISSSKKKRIPFHLVVLELDTATLEMKSLTESKADLYSQTNGLHLLERDMTYQLNKGEILVVFSPGFIFNWKEVYPNEELNTFLKLHETRSVNDLIDELFIRLKETSSDKFLKRDATLVIMEVNRHGIYKV
jgi:hypothetical protein